MSFWKQHGDLISAGITVVVAAIAAKAADVAISRRGKSVAVKLARGELSPASETRLRLLRRLVVAAILVVGLALALRYVDSAERIATGLLASSAVLGLIVGFAARSTLSNAIAGLMLALTQVIRIGDRVTWESSTGTVEDVRLNYTFIRTDNGRRLVVPNSSLTAKAFENHTIVSPTTRVEISLWLPLHTDLASAKAAIGEVVDGATVTVAELDKEHVRIKVDTEAPDPGSVDELGAVIRERCLTRLQAEGMIHFDISSR